MYSWEQFPYVPVPYSSTYPIHDYSNSRDVAFLRQQVEGLQREWQDLREKMVRWEVRSNVHPSASETGALELMKGLEEQINSLRAEQISAYEQIMNQFLSNQMTDRIQEIQKDITPSKIVRQISEGVN